MKIVQMHRVVRAGADCYRNLLAIATVFFYFCVRSGKKWDEMAVRWSDFEMVGDVGGSGLRVTRVGVSCG
ncbi:hypothetical protein [Rubritalea tangerina]|uniref:hypothetical protein n=1 Tax=Rubritalea tangerina TaxID=430798 RepID=UPI003610B772